MVKTHKIGAVEECTNDFSKVTITIDNTQYEWMAEKRLVDMPQAVADMYNNGKPTQDEQIISVQFLDLLAGTYFGKHVDETQPEQVKRFYNELATYYGRDFVNDIDRIKQRLDEIVTSMQYNKFPA